MTAQPLANPISAYPLRNSSGALANPILDFLIGASFLSVLLFFFFKSCSFLEKWPAVLAIPFYVNFVCNQPHYAATYYRVYRRWEDIKTYSLETIVAPIVLLAASVAAIAMPVLVAPWFCKLYLLTSGYHYSGQNYGLSLIYSEKSGLRLGKIEKLILCSLLFSAFFHRLISADAHHMNVPFLENVKLPDLGLPMWSFYAIHTFFWIMVVVYLGMNVRMYKTKGQMLPWLTQALVMSHLYWWVFGVSDRVWWMFVPIFHCAQYLLVTTYYHMRKTWSGVTSELTKTNVLFGLKYYILLIVVGNLLFTASPFLLEKIGICGLAFATAIIGSFQNLHHFVLDGQIWKLRDPKISRRFGL
jgi:hypothetical protein